MRTVVENRYGVDRETECQDFDFVHLEQRPTKSRSFFYDFGERRRVKFVECMDDGGSSFVASLMKEICS